MRFRVCATISLARMPARVMASHSSRRAKNAPNVATMSAMGARDASAMSFPKASSGGYLMDERGTSRAGERRANEPPRGSTRGESARKGAGGEGLT
jgi:hypothetical protein